MQTTLQKYQGIILHAVPSLIAISLLETVNIQVYLHGPISQGPLLLLAWLTLQMIPGFVFGYISDQYYRKMTLIISQALGLIGGIVLAIYGFEIWVLVLIALTFNPMPVARAAFLDNFPQHSTMKLISITLIAQYLPWAFYDYLAKFHYQTIVFGTLGVLALNIALTVVWFKDAYDKKELMHKKPTNFPNKVPILLTLIAFTLAETTFYILWTFLEETPGFHSWQSIITYGTLIGISMAMMYNRLPHISIITLFYSIGTGFMLAVLARCIFSSLPCNETYVTAMSCFSIIGGLYLPFVTVAVIDMFGPKHKAMGSAMIEFSDTIASFVAPITSFLIHEEVYVIVIISLILCTLAAIIQRLSERITAI